MTCKEIAEKYGVSKECVAVWARNNGVKRGEIVHGIVTYDWTEEDCERFLKRKPVGRPRKN